MENVRISNVIARGVFTDWNIVKRKFGVGGAMLSPIKLERLAVGYILYRPTKNNLREFFNHSSHRLISSELVIKLTKQVINTGSLDAIWQRKAFLG